MKKVSKEIIINIEDTDRLSTILAGRGVADSRRAAVNVQLLRRDTSTQNIFDKLLPSILQSVIDSPDPDMSLSTCSCCAGTRPHKIPSTNCCLQYSSL